MDILSLPEVTQEEKEEAHFIELDFPDINFVPEIKIYQDCSKTTALAEKILNLRQYKDLKKQIQKSDQINNKKISLQEIIETVSQFLHSDCLTFIDNSRLLMSFGPVENALMQYIYLNFSEENTTFLENWKVFSFAAHNIIQPQNIELKDALDNLGKLLCETMIFPSFEMFQSIFLELDQNSYTVKNANLFERAIHNFRKLLKSEFSENQEIINSFENLSKRIENIVKQIRFLDFVKSIDQVSARIPFNFTDDLTIPKKIYFIQKSLSFPLLYLSSFTNPDIIDHETIKSISTNIRKIQIMSTYSPPEDLVPLLVEYIKSCTIFEKLSSNMQNIFDDISLISDFLNAQKEIYMPLYSSYQDFVGLCERKVQKIHIKYNELLSKFILFRSLINKSSLLQHGFTIEIHSAVQRISNYLYGKCLAEAFKNDAVLFLRFCQSQIGYKPSLLDSINAVIESIQNVLDAKLIKEPYGNYLYRLMLMFSVFKCLYNSSASHLRESAHNFFKFFPNIFELSDFFNMQLPGKHALHISYEESNQTKTNNHQEHDSNIDADNEFATQVLDIQPEIKSSNSTVQSEDNAEKEGNQEKSGHDDKHYDNNSKEKVDATENKIQDAIIESKENVEENNSIETKEEQTTGENNSENQETQNKQNAEDQKENKAEQLEEKKEDASEEQTNESHNDNNEKKDEQLNNETQQQEQENQKNEEASTHQNSESQSNQPEQENEKKEETPEPQTNHQEQEQETEKKEENPENQNNQPEQENEKEDAKHENQDNQQEQDSNEKKEQVINNGNPENPNNQKGEKEDQNENTEVTKEETLNQKETEASQDPPKEEKLDSKDEEKQQDNKQKDQVQNDIHEEIKDEDKTNTNGKEETKEDQVSTEIHEEDHKTNNSQDKVNDDRPEENNEKDVNQTISHKEEENAEGQHESTAHSSSYSSDDDEEYEPIFDITPEDINIQTVQTLIENITKTITSQKLEDETIDKLNKILSYMSATSSFYNTFIEDNAISSKRYEFIIDTTEETGHFVELIEAILPLLSFTPTCSLQLCEKTFALVLLTLYKPYAAKDISSKIYDSVRSSLFLRLPNLSFRFTTSACYFFSKLIKRGSIKNIPLEAVESVNEKFKNMMHYNGKTTPKELLDSINHLFDYLKTYSLNSSLLYLSQALCYLEKVSEKMSKAAKCLDIDDTLVEQLVPLSVVASIAQSIVLMYQQLTGQPISDSIHKIWPFNSGQTNVVIFAEVKPEDINQIVQFIISHHENIPVLPSGTFIDAAHALIQECYVYANSLCIEAAISKTISEILDRITQISMASEKTNDFEAFSTDTFYELYVLENLLRSRPMSYASLTALDDIKNFKGMILEYKTFTQFKVVFQACYDAISNLPPPFRPDMPEDLEFIEQKSEDSSDSAEKYSFDEPLEKLRNAYKGKENEENASPIIEELAKYLDHPKISVDPIKVDEQSQRFIARIQTTNQRMELKIQEIQKEQERIASQHTTVIYNETQNTKTKLDQLNIEISALSKEKSKRENQLKSLKDDTDRLYSEYHQLKQEIGLNSTLPSSVTIKDIEDSNDEGNKSEPAQKSADLIEFTKSIKEQNTKLKAAIQRASILKKVPALKKHKPTEEENVLLELVKKRDQLKEEVKELEMKSKGISTKQLFDMAGFHPLSIPQEVKDFMEMADKVRTGRLSEVNVIDFLSAVESTENFVYNLSQNRRDFVAFANSPAAVADSEEDNQEIDEADV